MCSSDLDKCKACGICANKCPKGVLTGKKPAAPKADAPKPEAPKPDLTKKEEKSE